MKKIIFAVAIAVIAGFNAYKANTTKAQISDLLLSNVEQLAEGECGFGYHCKFYRPEGRCIVCNSPQWSYCPELECKGKF